MPDPHVFLTSYAQEAFLRCGAPGLALGVARKGEPIYAAGLGCRDAEQQLACTPESLFPLGSMTKVLTAVAIMQLAEQGRLCIDDPVRLYLPEFRLGTGSDRITIRHLLTHSSGLPPTAGLFAAINLRAGNPTAVPVDLASLPALRTYGDLLDYLDALDCPLLGAPSAHFSYSNDGFALLGAIIERAGGQLYSQHIAQQIFRPAGMGLSCAEGDIRGERAELYRVGSDGRPEPAGGGWYSDLYLPAAFLWSNVSEMLRFLELFRTGGRVGQERLLTEASVAAMMRPHVQCHPTIWYGLGLFVTPGYHGVTLVEHGGNPPGASLQITCVPEQGLTAVALANGTGLPVPQLLLGAVNGVLGLPIGASRTDLPSLPAPPDLERYTGTYLSGEGRRVTVRLAEAGLAVEMGPSRFAARYVGDHAFLFHWPLLGYETPIQFELNEHGRAVRARVSFRTMHGADQ